MLGSNSKFVTQTGYITKKKFGYKCKMALPFLWAYSIRTLQTNNPTSHWKSYQPQQALSYL